MKSEKIRQVAIFKERPQKVSVSWFFNANYLSFYRCLAKITANRWQNLDVNENEVRVITMLAESLHLVLLNAPNISTPQDLDGIFLAPIYILIRIRDRKVIIP